MTAVTVTAVPADDLSFIRQIKKAKTYLMILAVGQKHLDNPQIRWKYVDGSQMFRYIVAKLAKMLIGMTFHLPLGARLHVVLKRDQISEINFGQMHPSDSRNGKIH